MKMSNLGNSPNNEPTIHQINKQISILFYSVMKRSNAIVLCSFLAISASFVQDMATWFSTNAELLQSDLFFVLSLLLSLIALSLILNLFRHILGCSHCSCTTARSSRCATCRSSRARRAQRTEALVIDAAEVVTTF